MFYNEGTNQVHTIVDPAYKRHEVKATFSIHKLFPKKQSNDYLIYYLVNVHHFHHNLLYQTRINL